ncbi:MAG: hypothetical protein LBP79_01315 [Clostridiales bacterium]|jgi:hypothetical protein|nr:hypothetical protein [Clostridiales bacterium]
MSNFNITTRLKVRRGVASSWASINPILLAGEVGLETDTRKFKFGNGENAWAALKYAAQNVILADAAPTAVTGYDTGQMWINATNGKIYALVVANEVKAWKNIYTTDEVDSLLAGKFDKLPDGENPILDENGKLNFVYIPDSIIGGLVYGGVINGSGIISASDHAEALEGVNLSTVNTADYPGYFFIFGADYTFQAVVYNAGDWIISQGNHTPAWAKIDNSDMVSSVNNKTGAVTLTTDDIPEAASEPQNLYFTEARFAVAFAGTESTDLADGESILHSTDDIVLDGGIIE